MTITFRERAAIALLAGGPYLIQGAVAEAQKLADECCKAWGHVDPEAREMPAHLAAMMGPMADECPRCGKVVPPPKENR